MVGAVDINRMRRRIKERRPQFVRMNPAREEAPPPRHITCPDYRACLAEAALQNFCLDCSQCPDEDAPQPAATCLPRPELRNARPRPLAG